MTAVLLDTHAWVWSFADDNLLSPAARAAIMSADAVHVSPISFFEIGQKVRLGKWPEMVPFADRLQSLLADQGGLTAALTAEICLAASLDDWPHGDPFDRIIAASAQILGLTLVSRDAAFSARPGLRVVW